MPEFNLMEAVQDWRGFVPARQARVTESDAAAFVDLLSNRARMPAHRQEYLLKEVITTDSFADLFGFTLQRDMIARYRAAIPDWLAYCPTGTMPNFNIGERHKVQGNDTLLQPVNEKGEYLVAPVSSGHYHRQVFKYGRQFDISWEAIINDFLDAFGDVAARFAEAATYSRAYRVTDAMCSAAGPDALMFGAALADTADGQLITNVGTLGLTIANLEATMALMAMQTDVNGRPLGIQGAHLVVPPALEFTARAILTSALKQWTEVGAGAGIPVPTTNVIPQMGLKLHVNRLIPVIDVSVNVNTTWYLFADPVQGRAFQLDLLRGHEEPEICMKSSDKVTTSGALIDPFGGDFATDNIFYRVRDVHGVARLDRRYCYSQNGTT